MKGTGLGGLLIERSSIRDRGVYFINGEEKDEFLSYLQLYQSALRTLYILQTRGMRPGDELVFQVEANQPFIQLFWACILGGIRPVPLTIGRYDDHRNKLFNVWDVLNHPYLAIDAGNLERTREFAVGKNLVRQFSEMVERTILETEWSTSDRDGEVVAADEDDIAYIQFSSGSTGNPKGVIVTHTNLLVNMRAIATAGRYATHESMLSWMPLTHDMGLIGFHLNPLFAGMDHFLMPPALFVRRPDLWLMTASKYRVNILSSPNFGYEHMLKNYSLLDKDAGLDLSSIRLLYNGAEPISDRLCRRFTEVFSVHGLKKSAICPVYGLAEATLAVTMSDPDHGVVSIAVDRERSGIGQTVDPVPENAGTITFVDLGRAIDNCSLRIVDGTDRVVGEGSIGHIQISGGSVTSGYYNNDRETRNSRTPDGWLRTGDTGFVLKGSLYFTGRAKDVLFLNGQNFYPHDIERVAQELAGIELNRIAVSGFFNGDSQREEIVAFVQHKGDIKAFVGLMQQVQRHINSKVGIFIERVLPVKDIPRSTSGKLQRYKLLERLLNGDFDDAERAIRELTAEQPAAYGGPGLSADGAAPPPMDDKEARLVAIWSKVLRRPPQGRDQSFFEAGGNSLRAAEASLLLSREFGVEFSIATLYENPTMAGWAAGIETLRRRPYRPIPVFRDKRTYLPTPSQRRLYYAWEMNKASIAYNIPIAFALQGNVDVQRLQGCIQHLIERHDALRTRFSQGPELECVVAPSMEFELERVMSDGNTPERQLRSWVQPFDLDRGPLFRIKLWVRPKDGSILFMDFHHSISDGMSVYHFVDELLRRYNGYPLPEAPVQFADYAAWIRDAMQQRHLATQGQYWESRLAGDLPLLQLPVDLSRPVVFDTAGAKLEFELDPVTLRKCKQLARVNGCTLHVLFFTIYNLLLSKYTGQQSIIVGIPVAGRGHSDLQDVQGMFVNSLAVRSDIDGKQTFRELLGTESRIISEALDNQLYFFDDLIGSLHDKRDPGRNPLFDTMFVYQNMGTPGAGGKGLAVSRYFFDPGFTKFDLSLEIFEEEETMTYSLEYATGLFHRETILRLQQHFVHLIGEVISNEDRPASQLSILPAQEYQRTVFEFNATKIPYPETRMIHELFEEQAGRTPDWIAIEYGAERISYAQLNARADQLARALRKRGVTTGALVGVCLERSPQLIIGLLAILKAGGCYLPIDIDIPPARISYLLKDSQCGHLLLDGTDTRSRDIGISMTTGIIEINDPHPAGDEASAAEANEVAANVRDLAYVIYTSGTTGRPKGVMIEHRSLVNYICWARSVYAGEARTSFPLFTSIAFDLTVTSIFTPLVSGGTIVIYGETREKTLMEEVLRDNRVEAIKLTPSHLKLMNDHLPGEVFAASRIRTIIVGGEKLETRLARSISEKFRGKAAIFNEYGPTEATVGCMIYRLTGATDTQGVPIGIPAANTRIYLLDDYLVPVPCGVSGEIYIAGDGLARGYLHDPAITKTKFIPDPFVTGERMYKTGDIARRLPAGDIDFIGRFDQQVKISGHRIDLSEIERQLLDYEGIREALVLLQPGVAGRKDLTGYYIAGDPGTVADIDEAELKGWLASVLPHYMIPIRFIRLEKMPLTSNGKIDRQALPLPQAGPGAKQILPEDAVETRSLEVWQAVFGTDRLSVTDNFFELGGDSIKAAQIVSKLFQLGISVSIKDVLTYHTIRQISRHATIGGPAYRYEQGIVRGEKGLTPIEQWFFGLQLHNPHFFNQSVLLRFKKTPEAGLLRQAFEAVIGHHDGLRLNYDREKNTLIYNEELLTAPFNFGDHTLDANGKENGLELRAICRRIKAGLDISRGCLVAAALIKGDAPAPMLFITAHHLVVDAVSWRILLEDLYLVYNQLEKGVAARLPLKSASLRDWQNHLLEQAQAIPGEQDYRDAAKRTDFLVPLDVQPRDWRMKHQACQQATWKTESLSRQLRGGNRRQNIGIPVILHTALVLTLKEWTGRTRFTVEAEDHGRQLGSMDVSRTTGWFTVLYPLMLECKGETLTDQLEAVAGQLQAVPWKGMMPLAGSPGATNGEGVPEIRFNYLGQFSDEMNNQLFYYCRADTGPDSDDLNPITAKLEFNLMIIDWELELDIRYNQLAFKETTIAWLKDQFLFQAGRILDHIADKKEEPQVAGDFEAPDLDKEELDRLFHLG